MELTGYARPQYTGVNGSQASVDLAQGFIDRDALKLLRSTDAAKADAAYPGCGTRPGVQMLTFADNKPFDRDDRYQSPNALENFCPRALQATGCGAPLAGYQGPSFAPDVVMLTSSSTAVSGEQSKGTGPGGIVRAVVPRSRSFRLLDYTGKQRATTDPLQGYADPNVPCGVAPSATWYFVDANPGRSSGEHQLYGWTAVKTATAQPVDPNADSNKQGPCGP